MGKLILNRDQFFRLYESDIYNIGKVNNASELSNKVNQLGSDVVVNATVGNVNVNDPKQVAQKVITKDKISTDATSAGNYQIQPMEEEVVIKKSDIKNVQEKKKKLKPGDKLFKKKNFIRPLQEEYDNFLKRLNNKHSSYFNF